MQAGFILLRPQNTRHKEAIEENDKKTKLDCFPLHLPLAATSTHSYL